MYKEVAIDPKCMAKIEYYYLLKRDFGFNEGRYVVADIKQWAKTAFQIAKCSDIPPAKKKSVTNFLNKVQRGKITDTFVLTQDRKVIQESIWEEWRTNQSDHRKFSTSVSESRIFGCLNHDAIIEGCDEWKIPKSILIKRTSAVDIVATIEPLLYLSKELTLIDPYFRLFDNKTLAELFKVLQRNSVIKLTVVSTVDNPDYQKTYDDNYKQLNTRSISFRWVKVQNGSFHDRYLLTDVGAIAAGQGFMTAQEKGVSSDKLEMNLVDKKVAQERLQDVETAIKEKKAVVFELEK